MALNKRKIIILIRDAERNLKKAKKELTGHSDNRNLENAQTYMSRAASALTSHEISQF